MSESAYRVDTAPRFAQWRNESLTPCTNRKSSPFKIGNWNWYLSVERNVRLYVKLYPDPFSVTREQPPIASFIIKLVNFSAAPNRKIFVHPGVCDKQLKNSEDFVWAIETFVAGKFIIDVEFLDLKKVPQSGGDPASIWYGCHIEKQSPAALNTLGRMLTEGIHTDITINAINGTIAAHRAVLATRSPVFRSMFSHNLKEKELSAVNISDMSFEACQAFFNYIYGNIHADEFLTHRIALLMAADKYAIGELMEACYVSLLEDIDAKNVLERLQTAHLYRLKRLKAGCLRYLVNFGKIYEIHDDFNVFLQGADRELITEIFQEILTGWKYF